MRSRVAPRVGGGSSAMRPTTTPIAWVDEQRPAAGATAAPGNADDDGRPQRRLGAPGAGQPLRLAYILQVTLTFYPSRRSPLPGPRRRHRELPNEQSRVHQRG